MTDELTPSMAAEINPTNIVGIIGRKGGKTSHSAILARALGIPAVLLSAFIIVYPFLRYAFYSYGYDQTRITIKKGVIFKSRVIY